MSSVASFAEILDDEEEDEDDEDDDEDDGEDEDDGVEFVGFSEEELAAQDLLFAQDVLSEEDLSTAGTDHRCGARLRLRKWVPCFPNSTSGHRQCRV